MIGVFTNNRQLFAEFGKLHYIKCMGLTVYIYYTSYIYISMLVYTCSVLIFYIHENLFSADCDKYEMIPPLKGYI